MGFQEIVGKFLLATILCVSLFSFIIFTQSENDSPDPIINNEIFNNSYQSIQENIADSTSSASEKYNVFNTEEPTPGFGSIVLFGIVSVGKTFSNIVFGFFGALIKLPLVVLGIPESIASLLTTWLIILVIIGVWLLYKLGG